MHANFSQPNQPQPPGSAAAGPAATVPMSVYRQLAAELKTTKAALDAAQQHKAQLLGQNERLRVEIDRLAQATQALQQLATPTAATVIQPPIPTALTHQPVAAMGQNANLTQAWDGQTLGNMTLGNTALGNANTPGTQLQPAPPNYAPNGLPAAEPIAQLFSEQGQQFQAFEQEEKRGWSEQVSSSLNSGWWMGIAITLIGITAFTISFILVRPINPQSR